MTITDHMRNIHLRYLQKHLKTLSSSSSSLDTSRIALLFFAISGLDLLNGLDQLTEDTKKEIIDWIYLQQLQPANKDDNLPLNGKFGFRGSPTNGDNSEFDYCNLTITYCALATLLILGDDFSRLNKSAIIKGLKEHQKSDGRFVQALIEGEDDLRITYSAATICYILNDWTSIDSDLMFSFIRNCQSYENGFGQTPGTEAHGGTTFCAIASLYLMDRLSEIDIHQKNAIIRWCLQRQVSGFQGRPYKDPDTCYSFWVGASLDLLDSYQFVNDQKNIEFLDSTQELMIGGFSKHPDDYPDIMHTFLGISALSVRAHANVDGNKENKMQPVYPALNISMRAYEHLKSLHSQWNVHC